METIKNNAATQQIGQIGGPPFTIMPLIGERAAPFVADTTKGPINFPFDYEGKWVIFFSHPGDFEPVCTTEFIAFQQMQEEFKSRNAELLGLSVDSLASHLAWIQDIYRMNFDGVQNININFPIIADPLMEVSKLYGMVHRGETETRTVRTLFIIDPNAIVRTILYYSPRTGRNINEVMRALIALQTSDEQDILTPANWEPGEPVIITTPQTVSELIARLEREVIDPTLTCPSWYLCFRPEVPEFIVQNKTIKRTPPKPSTSNIFLRRP